MDRFKAALSLSLLAVQLGTIAYARFVPTRYLCWAPYDQFTTYELQSVLEGRELSPEEIGKRYRRSWMGFDPRSPAHITDIVERVELALPPVKRAKVTMRHSVNGKRRPDWHFPGQ